MVRRSVRRRSLGTSLRQLFDWLSGAAGSAPRSSAALALEALETRLTPSSYTVTNTSSLASVNGSLASVVAQADADTTGTPITISFASGSGQAFATAKTIKLASTLNLTNTTSGASITIQAPTSGVTLEGGGTSSNFSVFKINAGTIATLNGLTITDGSSSTGGAGIDNVGTLTLTSVNVTDNTATGGANGAGILNAVGATLTITNGTLSGNTADGSGGGLENFGTATLTGLTVSKNTAHVSGGGIDNGATLTVVDSTLTSNTASLTGGGLNNNDGSATVDASTLLSNTAASGGGAFDANHGTLTLLNATVASNSASSGGGLFVDVSSTLAVSASTVTTNKATSGSGGGGGIDDYHSLVLADSIVANNTANLAPDVDANGNTITGSHDVIGVNSSLAAAGLTNGQDGNVIGAPALLANLGNHGGSTETVGLLPGSPALGGAGALTTVADAASSTATSLTLTNAAAVASSPGSYDIVIDGEEMTVTSVDLSTNTVTVTRAVNSESAALSAGDSVYLFADQRGIDRSATGGDIGAFQDQGFTLTVASSSTPQSTAATTAFAKPLAVTVVSKDTGVSVAGGTLSFTATPGTNNQSATLSSATATVSAAGLASVTATANADTGAYTVTATAGANSATFNLTNLTAPAHAPVFTSADTATFTVGTSSSFTVTATGSPAPTLTEADSDTVPAGLSFDPSTGILSGMPAANTSGTYTLHFTATNASSVTQTFTLVIIGAPSITTQPTSQTVDAGQTVSFTAAASAVPTATVQWQVSTDGGVTFSNIVGQTYTTLSFPVTIARNGDEFQAVFTNGHGSVTSAPATLTVAYVPQITSQPTGQGVVAGQTATFTVADAANPDATVQWQVQAAGTTGFTNIDGATSSSLTVTDATAEENGNEYRAVLTNTVGSTNSQAATLTVGTAPTVTTSPSSSVTVNAGQTVTLQSAASGTPTPTVQWQVSTDGGSTFTNVAGATSATLSFAATAADNGNVYQAVVTNAVGSATTNTATLTVDFAPQLTAQPSKQAVTADSTATFTAAASANPSATVQWQQAPAGSTTFTNISGATDPTLTVPDVSASASGDQYRAVFTNTVGTVTTQTATLTVGTAPAITIQPQAASATVGQVVILNAAATGTPTPTVQWQVSTNGGSTFSNVFGATTTTLTFKAQAAQNGNLYQAVFQNALQSVTSNPVALTVTPTLIITQQPTNQAEAVGDNAVFTAAVNANPTATVQWQDEAPGAKTFTNVSGATATTLTVSSVTTAESGTLYRAVFTNSAGKVTTSTATLTVDVAPTVTASPAAVAAQAGQSVTFTAAATGTPTPTVQWQISTDSGSTYTNIAGATSTTLKVTAQANQTGALYRAVFTNALGSVDSDAATLTIW